MYLVVQPGKNKKNKHTSLFVESTEVMWEVVLYTRNGWRSHLCGSQGERSGETCVVDIYGVYEGGVPLPF